MRSNTAKTEEKEPPERLRQLTQEVLNEISELDSSHSKEMLESFVSELFLSVAKQKRQEFRRQRQAEGIAVAKAAGVRFGRERLAPPSGFEEMAQLWHEGSISATRAAGELKMSRDTFLRRAREYCVGNLCPH